MTRCSWAACTAPARRQDDDGHWHCPPHWEQHLAFAEEDEIRSRLATRTKADPKVCSQQRIRDVQTCVALGMDTNEIAQHLGLHDSYVRDLRRQGGVAPEPRQAACGTRSGYERHRERGEEVCAPCADARRKYDKERYGRRRRAA